jgi:hypothetical protein
MFFDTILMSDVRNKCRTFIFIKEWISFKQIDGNRREIADKYLEIGLAFN